MGKTINKKAVIIVLSILTIFIIFFLFILLENTVIFDGDDLNSTYDSYPIAAEENGRYVFNFLSRVFCLYIPKLFGIHIQNAINTFCVFIYALILSFLFSITASFYFIKGKSTILYIIFYIISAIVFFIYALEFGSFYSAMVTFQYGYVLASACNILFLFFIMSYILGEKYKETNTKSKKYISLVFLAFCAGNSTQIATYTVFISMFLMSIVIFIKHKFKFKETKEIIWNKVTKKPIIAYISGLVLMVSCPGFWNEVAIRHADSVQNIIDIFPAFLNCYNEYIFQNYSSYYLFVLFILAIFMISTFIKKENIKDSIFQLVISVIPFVGVWAYFFTLILGGATFPSEPLSFWVKEPFYHFYFRMLQYCIIFLIIGLINNNMNNRLIKSILMIIIVTAGLFISKVFNIDNKSIQINTDLYKNYICNLKNYRNELSEIRKFIYTQDKMILTSKYKGQNIIEFDSNNLNPVRYFRVAYNINLEEPLLNINKEKALEYFKTNGGVITEEELEKTDFQKLFDRDFVLNNNR